MSIEEVEKLFINDKGKKAKPTKYAGTRMSEKGYSWWWLRSPGSHSVYVAEVNVNGWVDREGDFVHNDCFGVRPTLWMNL